MDQYPGQPQYQYQQPAPQNVDQTMAIISLVLGIASIVLCAGLPGPIAVFLGFKARKKAREFPGQYGGDALALVGIITGAVGCVVLLLMILYFIFVFGIIGISLLSH